MISAASSSFGSWVRTAIAVARSMPPSCANASSGHAATTSSASGKRAGCAKRARGSTTNGRQPAARASRHSAAAKSTAPKAISRGGGNVDVDEQDVRRPRRGARSARATSARRRAGRRRRPAPGRRASPCRSPSARDEHLRARRRRPTSTRDERAAPAAARQLGEVALRRSRLVALHPDVDLAAARQADVPRLLVGDAEVQQPRRRPPRSTCSATSTTAPSTQPPDTAPEISPCSLTAILEPGGRGAERLTDDHGGQRDRVAARRSRRRRPSARPS